MFLGRLAVSSAQSSSRSYDPWYVKAAFGVFLCVLVATLILTYSGVPVPHFIIAR